MQAMSKNFRYRFSVKRTEWSSNFWIVNCWLVSGSAKNTACGKTVNYTTSPSTSTFFNRKSAVGKTASLHENVCLSRCRLMEIFNSSIWDISHRFLDVYGETVSTADSYSLGSGSYAYAEHAFSVCSDRIAEKYYRTSTSEESRIFIKMSKAVIDMMPW